MRGVVVAGEVALEHVDEAAVELDVGVVGLARARSRAASYQRSIHSSSTGEQVALEVEADRVERARGLGGEDRDRRVQRRTSDGGHLDGAARRARRRATPGRRASISSAEAHDRAVRAPARARRRAPGRGRSRSRCPGATGDALAVDQSARPRPRASRSARGSRAGAASRAPRSTALPNDASSQQRRPASALSGVTVDGKSMHRRGSAIANAAPARDPESHHDLTATQTLPDTLRLGPVDLTVADLDRSVAWYQRSLGLRVHTHEATTADARRRRRAPSLDPPRGPARPARRPPRRPLPLRAAVSRRREELARAAVRLSVTADPDRGRLRPPHPRGDLPRPTPTATGSSSPPTARATHWPADLGYAGGPAAARLPTRCWPRSTARSRAPHVATRPAHGPPAPARRRHRRRASPSTATCSASRSQANLGTAAFVSRRRLPPSPRLQRLARPRRRPRARAHRRPAPLDDRAPGGRPRRGPRPRRPTPRTCPTAASSSATRGTPRSRSSPQKGRAPIVSARTCADTITA